MGTIKIAGFDPGMKTGFAVIEIDDKRNIKPLKIGVFDALGLKKQTPVGSRQREEAHDLIKEVDHVVIEDFLLDPKLARQIGNKANDMPASVVKGALSLLADLERKTWKYQSRTIKPVGYGLAGMVYRKGTANMHHQDAFAHAVYYAVHDLRALPVPASRSRSSGA